MRNKIVAATLAMVTVGAFASVAMAAGPKESSANYIPGMAVGTPVSSYDAAMQGPKVSSENHIPATPPTTLASVQPPTGAQHWVYQQGYDPHGKWHWHWVLIP